VTLSFYHHSRFYKEIAANMAENIYDEVEIEDMTYDPTLEIYHYPCPCGDRFEIGIADLRDGEEIAVCPSCSLMIKVIFEVVSKDLALATVYSMADLVV
jgi:diphthamide biosynthesis protein 3